jgi:hypothetical protein
MIGCENRWGRYCLDDQAIEKACKTMVLAYSTGKPLNVLSHEIALITAKSWDDYANLNRPPIIIGLFFVLR